MSATPEVAVSTALSGEALANEPVRKFENGLPIHRRMKKPILCQNQQNTYRFVPEEIAREKIKEGLLVELHPWDADYIKGVKLALGVWDGFKPGEVVQVFGQAMRAEELGKLDRNKVLQMAEAEVKKYYKDKEAGILPVKELPKDLGSFEGKKQRNRFAK